jgi:hypothetical protein
LHRTEQKLYTVLYYVPDERKNCFDGDTPASKTNKFKRCWRGIKYTKKLPAVFKWDVHFRNKTQLAMPVQNGTEQAMTHQNGTEDATSPQNRTEEANILKNVTQKPSVM